MSVDQFTVWYTKCSFYFSSMNSWQSLSFFVSLLCNIYKSTFCYFGFESPYLICPAVSFSVFWIYKRMEILSVSYNMPNHSCHVLLQNDDSGKMVLQNMSMMSSVTMSPKNPKLSPSSDCITQLNIYLYFKHKDLTYQICIYIQY